MQRKQLIGLAATLLWLPMSGLAAEESGDIASAISSGKASAGIRYRYEHVDQDNVAENADASTARLRLNYRTGQWQGWSAFGEFDYVFHALLRDFNAGGGTTPGRTQYPTVADPRGADLNQLYLDYSNSDVWKMRLGRQRILLDNQRFVGGVGWRQNEQTYDGLTLTSNAFPQTAFSYTYVNYVRRIFGEDSAAGKDKLNGHLLNAKVRINDTWNVVPYAYFLDYEDLARAGNSTTTLGARVSGSVAMGEGKLALVGEFARQSDAADNPVDYDASYWHIDAAWAMTDELSFGLGIESLGADGATGQSFRTPLATLHKFQGWADQFLGTPPGGIDDLYATVKFKTGVWNLTGVYHDFSAETGGGDYGSEFDVSVGRGFAERYTVLFKGAFFSGDSASFPDVNKFWIMLTASY